MLAQNFMTAEVLGIKPEWRDALITVLGMMERGELVYVTRDELARMPTTDTADFTGHFSMQHWNWPKTCGSVCCIGGTAEWIGGVWFDDVRCRNSGEHITLGELFYDYPGDPTIEQAARALRNYLTLGDPRWAEAMS
jgi:hypothetical protein